MRICLLTPTFFPQIGGTEVVTDKLARAFNAAGHQTFVLAMRRKQKINMPYDVHWTGRPIGWRWFPSRFIPHFTSLHSKYNFDIIASNYGWPTGYVASIAAKKLKIPLAITSHGGDLFYASINRRIKGIWQHTIDAYHRADGLIAISEYTEKMIREVRPDAPMLKRIPNGVDAVELRSPATRPTDFTVDKPFLLCLGNLKKQKGFDIALKSFAKVVHRLDDIHLAIVGSGRDFVFYRKMIKDLNLQGKVTMLGSRTGNDKRWLMQNCKFGLMPSREEGHPIVGLEFMALGKPIICTTISAFDGLFDDGKNGLRVEAEDENELANAMIKLSKMNLDLMSQNCLERIPEYEWSVIAESYIQFYQEVINNYQQKNEIK